MTRRNWDGEQKRKQIPNKEELRKREQCPIAVELIIRRWAKRMTERRFFPPASVSSDVWASVYPSLRREGTLTAHVTPWAKQFRDDIEALKELDEGERFRA